MGSCYACQHELFLRWLVMDFTYDDLSEHQTESVTGGVIRPTTGELPRRLSYLARNLSIIASSLSSDQAIEELTKRLSAVKPAMIGEIMLQMGLTGLKQHVQSRALAQQLVTNPRESLSKLSTLGTSALPAIIEIAKSMVMAPIEAIPKIGENLTTLTTKENPAGTSMAAIGGAAMAAMDLSPMGVGKKGLVEAGAKLATRELALEHARAAAKKLIERARSIPPELTTSKEIAEWMFKDKAEVRQVMSALHADKLGELPADLADSMAMATFAKEAFGTRIPDDKYLQSALARLKAASVHDPAKSSAGAARGAEKPTTGRQADSSTSGRHAGAQADSAWTSADRVRQTAESTILRPLEAELKASAPVAAKIGKQREMLHRVGSEMDSMLDAFDPKKPGAAQALVTIEAKIREFNDAQQKFLDLKRTFPNQGEADALVEKYRYAFARELAGSDVDNRMRELVQQTNVMRSQVYGANYTSSHSSLEGAVNFRRAQLQDEFRLAKADFAQHPQEWKARVVGAKAAISEHSVSVTNTLLGQPVNTRALNSLSGAGALKGSRDAAAQPLHAAREHLDWVMGRFSADMLPDIPFAALKQLHSEVDDLLRYARQNLAVPASEITKMSAHGQAIATRYNSLPPGYRTY